jgi:maleamate amidohydrolase
MNELKDWMKIIPEEDLATYRQAGFMGGMKFGRRAALIVVDVTFGFTGSRGLTLKEAIAEYSTACGPVSWEAMPRIARLIGLFRAAGHPIVFTRAEMTDRFYAGSATKSKAKPLPAHWNEFPEEITPREGEWIVEKTKASGFFQTPMMSYLMRNGIDTAVICGVSTSGCVRATTVDSLSNGLSTFVVDDCCFDRSWFSHCSNLFDMHAKYAQVISLADVEELISGVKRADAA